MTRFNTLLAALHGLLHRARTRPEAHYVIVSPADKPDEYILVSTKQTFIPTIPVGDHTCILRVDFNEQGIALLSGILTPDLFPKDTNGQTL